MPPKKKVGPAAKNNAGKARATSTKKKSVTAATQKAVSAALEPAQRSSRRKRGLSPESTEDVEPAKKPKLSSKSNPKAEKTKRVAEDTPKANTDAVKADKVSLKILAPVFEGTFDIFATDFDAGKLYSVFLPMNKKGSNATIEPDSLHADIKRRQALGECTARIELRKGGIYWGRPVDEEAETPAGCPGEFKIQSVQKIAQWKIKEDSEEMDICGDTFDFEDAVDTRPGPAVKVSLDIGEDECGVESAGGMLKMRRLWARNQDGDLEEVFEGYLKVDIAFNVLLQHRFDAEGRKYEYTFWAVRARKRDDGTIIGVKELKDEEGGEESE